MKTAMINVNIITTEQVIPNGVCVFENVMVETYREDIREDFVFEKTSKLNVLKEVK